MCRGCGHGVSGVVGKSKIAIVDADEQVVSAPISELQHIYGVMVDC